MSAGFQYNNVIMWRVYEVGNDYKQIYLDVTIFK